MNAFFSDGSNECTDMPIGAMCENVQIALDDTKVGFDLESFESTHDVYYSAYDVTQGLKRNLKSFYTLNYENYFLEALNELRYSKKFFFSF